MKTTMHSLLVVAAVFISGILAASTFAAETQSDQRVGVFDSRVIAYASFWSAEHQRQRSETIKDAKEAKKAGDTKRFQELSTALKNEQEKVHLQVFSTAPIDDVLAGMKDRLPEIEKRAGVTQLVSKWDATSLKKFPDAKQIDVTDELLREFKLNESQAKTVAELRTKTPLPLKDAEKLSREGKL